MAEGKVTVLVVEDDEDTAMAFRVLLESTGYRVVQAGNAADGLATLRAERPDLVLLDVMMPAGREGFAFVREVRAEVDEGLRELPILVVSALHRTTKQRFYPSLNEAGYRPDEELPVQGFLDKPVDFGVLLREIARLLSGEAATDSR